MMFINCHKIIRFFLDLFGFPDYTWKTEQTSECRTRADRVTPGGKIMRRRVRVHRHSPQLHHFRIGTIVRSVDPHMYPLPPSGTDKVLDKLACEPARHSASFHADMQYCMV